MKVSFSHYLFPLFCILVALICQYSGLDINLEQIFYDQQHHVWPYKSAWLTRDVLHDDARNVIVIIFFGIILFALATLFSKKFKPYRRTASFILLSSLTGIILVGLLKASTHMYTPWDLKEFGGLYPNIRLFDHVAANLPVGHAFPAGHASGGFALLSFYFAARQHHHRYSRFFLYGALGTGLLLGIDQQIRGAHMISHDLFTLAICWLSCLFWSTFLLPAAKTTQNTKIADTTYSIQNK